MIGQSLPEYIFIRISIACLRLVAPASIICIAASLYTNHWICPKWLGYYTVIEAAFYLLIYLPRVKLHQQTMIINAALFSKPAHHPPLLSRKEREKLFARCFAQSHDADLTAGWFYPSSNGDVHRENLIEWILWAIFSTNRDGLVEEWEEELEGYLTMIEKLLGRKLNHGRNDSVSCMKVTLDSVQSVHRPLMWYIIVAVVDTYTTISLLARGFENYTIRQCCNVFPPRLMSPLFRLSPHPQLSYWYRPHRSKTKLPILFIHGIGIGLWPYTPFLADLVAEDADVGIIAIELFPISMRMSSPPLARQDMLDAIRTVLDFHGISSFVVSGHSYGTVVAAHIMHEHVLSSRVAAWLLVDPIPFLLHLPAVAYNFLYRSPSSANQWQLWYFASRDPDVARVLARHFFWAESILWKEDLKGRMVTIILSGRDQIVDAEEVRKYLTGEMTVTGRWRSEDGKLEVLWRPDLDHAKVFDTVKERRPMVKTLSRFIQVDNLNPLVDSR